MPEWAPFLYTQTVILLQIAVASPGTHFMKNHESQSRTNKDPIQKPMSPILKMSKPYKPDI